MAASREDTQFKMFFMSNDCSVEDSFVVDHEPPVVVVDFNEGGTMIPSVDGHVFGRHLTKATTRPCRHDVAVEVAFGVFTGLVMMPANGGCL